jgi:hypothetical protein
MILILFFNSHCDVILRLDRYQPNDSIATLHYASPADTELFSTKAMFTSLTNRRETSSCVNTVLSIFLPTFLLIGHKDQLSMWRISEMNKFYASSIICFNVTTLSLPSLVWQTQIRGN